MTTNSGTSQVAEWPTNSAVAETASYPRRIRPRSKPEPEDYRNQIVIDPMLRSAEVDSLQATCADASSDRTAQFGSWRGSTRYTGRDFTSGPPSGQPSPVGPDRFGQDAVGGGRRRSAVRRSSGRS